MILLSILLSCATENYARLYHVESKAPSLSWEDIENLKHMGPTVIDRGVNFCTFSEHAERIEILLFDDPESDLPTQQFPLIQRENLWCIYIEGIGLGQHYGYIAWGPNWVYDPEWLPGTTLGFNSDVDNQGNRFNPNKLLFDPWGKAIHRDHDWGRGSVASGPKRAESTLGAASKSVIVGSDYQWSSNEIEWLQLRSGDSHPNHAFNELIFYEVHPKGFTMNPASEVDHPGTYRGFGEMAPYLKDLGITAVELLPIHEKPLDGGYWGYNNLNFFGPENTFSAEFLQTGSVENVLDEFKWMVDQLHQNDVEVIIDVVYNHTGEGGLWRERLYFESYDQAYDVNFDPKEIAGLYSYRGLDNISYYALSPDGQTYWNNTGVGNQTRPNNLPMKHLIMDSLTFLVEELHVDGFRFDLAGILGEPDLDYNSSIDPSLTILQDIIDDPYFQERNIRMISEPWTASGTGPGIGGFPNASNDSRLGWFEWNAHYRDWWRSFVNEDDYGLNASDGLDGGSVMTGSSQLYGWNDRKPYHSVNFVTIHDGFTLYDVFSYDTKQNGCGLLNPICCDDPLSVWCDEESGENHNRSRNWGSDNEHFKRQQMRNLFTGLFFSHGSPMILGGDEWMRTQYGNNNSYSTWADNEWNWFRWGEWRNETAPHRARMHDFLRQLIQFRKEHLYAFNPEEHTSGMPFGWKSPLNTDMSPEDWGGRSVMIHYYKDDTWDKPELAILINMSRDALEFNLPEGRDWEKVIDTQSYYDTSGLRGEPTGYFNDNDDDLFLSANIQLSSPEAITEDRYLVQGSSIVIFEEKER